MLKSIIDYLKNSLKKYSGKVAFQDEQKEVTYYEVNDYAERIATYIIEQGCYMNKNIPIGVFMEEGCDILVSFIGIAMSGNIYAPIDCNAPKERIKKVIDILQPELIICDGKNYDLACSYFMDTKVILYDNLCKSGVNHEMINESVRRICDTDPLYILFTSGSTGVPKGVLVNHRAVIDFTEEASEVMGFSEKERFCNQAPFYFDASIPDIYCTIRNGATLYIPDKKRFQFPVKILQYIKKHSINAFFWVPSALIIIANLNVLNEVDISCVKKVMFCGEVMPTKQYNIWKKALPDALFVNYYGPCETTYACTYYIIDREFKDDEPLPIGRPALNTKIFILDGNEKVCTKNTIGELCISGSCLAMGYYNNPEKTREKFVQNPLLEKYCEKIYRTGDLVTINDFGELMYVCRKDFQIKHMGYRIELEEIEMFASTVNGVDLVACVYDSKCKQICLFYQGETDNKRIMETLKEKLPVYMIPQRIKKMEAMYMNSNGKIDRKRLVEEL